MWKYYKESKTVAGFLSVLMAFVMEDAEQFGQTLATLKKLFKEVVVFWFEMLNGEAATPFFNNGLGTGGDYTANVSPAAVDPVRAAAAGGTRRSIRLQVFAVAHQLFCSTNQSRWVPKSMLVWKKWRWRVTSRPWTP